MSYGGIDDTELERIQQTANSATPGPWYVRQLDDRAFMSLIAISSAPDTGRGEPWPEFDAGEIVAITLVQDPRYAAVSDERWEQNAGFIASARDDIPKLIGEIKRLRALLDSGA